MALCFALAGLPAGPVAQAQVLVGGAWPAYGPYAPYRYGDGYGHGYGRGWYGPWAPCAPGLCGDDFHLRRAIRREIEQQELRRELDARAQAGFPDTGASRYGARPDPPPPTPDSHLQPAYRGSGEVRPEYRDSGRVR